MAYSEEEVKRAAAMKQWLEERIRELREEEERLKDMLAIVNAVLGAASFKKASSLFEQITETRELRRQADGRLLAIAEITPKELTLRPAEGLKFYTRTPPFRSFFVGKILEGMRASDEEGVRKGELKPEEAFGYALEEEEGVLKRIIIRNYRDQVRLKDLLKSFQWTLERMLEKVPA
ncbi:MAG: hypothetical protein C4339_04895 [Nitrososphaerota archaeon]